MEAEIGDRLGGGNATGALAIDATAETDARAARLQQCIEVMTANEQPNPAAYCAGRP